MEEFGRKKRKAAGRRRRRPHTSVTVIEMIIGIDTSKIKAKNMQKCCSKIVAFQFCQTAKRNKCNNINNL